MMFFLLSMIKMIDWDKINNVMFNAKITRRFYKLYILNDVIYVNTGDYKIIFTENEETDITGSAEYSLLIHKNMMYKLDKDEYRILPDTLMRTSDWNDIRYIAYWVYSDSHYNYQDARKIYDRVGESKQASAFWQFDLRLLYNR